MAENLIIKEPFVCVCCGYESTHPRVVCNNCGQWFNKDLPKFKLQHHTGMAAIFYKLYGNQTITVR